MTPDPTTEIKRIRHQLGADDGYDLDRVFARLRRIQDEIGRECVRRPPRKPVDPLHRSGEPGVLAAENRSSPPGER